MDLFFIYLIIGAIIAAIWAIYRSVTRNDNDDFISIFFVEALGIGCFWILAVASLPFLAIWHFGPRFRK